LSATGCDRGSALEERTGGDGEGGGRSASPRDLSSVGDPISFLVAVRRPSATPLRALMTRLFRRSDKGDVILVNDGKSRRVSNEEYSQPSTTAPRIYDTASFSGGIRLFRDG
jgi:hypothetical protein